MRKKKKQKLTFVAHCKAKFLAQLESSSCWVKLRLSLMMVLWDMIVVATGPVASVAVKNWYQFCIIDINASMPTSVAQVTNHLTISLRRQLRDDKVILMTWRPSSKATLSKVGCLGPFSGVAKRKASWASLNRWDELWMCRWDDSRTVRRRRTSPEKN